MGVRKDMAIFIGIIVFFLVISADAAQLVDWRSRVGKTITVRGAVAETIWQHIVSPPKGYPISTYVDVGKDQTVVYSREPLSCAPKTEIRVTGKVIEIRGLSKKPGEDDSYREYHLVADTWSCEGR